MTSHLSILCDSVLSITHPHYSPNASGSLLLRDLKATVSRRLKRLQRMIQQHRTARWSEWGVSLRKNKPHSDGKRCQKIGARAGRSLDSLDTFWFYRRCEDEGEGL